MWPNCNCSTNTDAFWRASTQLSKHRLYIFILWLDYARHILKSEVTGPKLSFKLTFLTKTLNYRQMKNICNRVNLLSICEVNGTEQGVILRSWFPMLILIQKDRRAAHLHTQLLDALLVVYWQQEGLHSHFWLDGHKDGEILREHSSWRHSKALWLKISCCWWFINLLFCFSWDEWRLQYNPS